MYIRKFFSFCVCCFVSVVCSVFIAYKQRHRRRNRPPQRFPRPKAMSGLHRTPKAMCQAILPKPSSVITCLPHWEQTYIPKRAQGRT